jgi:hypothetical protein
MKYAVEMTAGRMIFIPSLMKTGRELKVVRRAVTHTDKHRKVIS